MNSNEPIVTKLRESFAARDETRTATDECPGVERIWDAADGALDPEETQQLVDHFIVCPSCAADWRIAASPASTVEADVVVFGSRRPIVRWAGLAATAALLVVATVALYQWVAPVPTEPVYRTTDEVIRSRVTEGLVLPKEDAVLRWTSAGEDALYSVEVGKIDLTPIASARELKGTEFVIPPEALERLEAGETIVWQVEALLSDGRRVVSQAFVNRIE